MIVGAGPGGRALARAVAGSRRVRVLGFLDEDPALWGSAVEGIPVLGPPTALEAWLEATGVSEVIMDPGRGGGMALAPVCLERGLAITDWVAAYEALLRQVPVGLDGEAPLRALTVSRPGLGFRLVHRAMDLVAGVLGLLLTGLLWPLVALGLRWESPGPVFYRQVRVGQGGRPFVLWKFRTMVLTAEAAGPTWAQEGDARVTRLGRLLRRFHLDEVPQAWNILKGEMSFIGPRPERPEFIGLLDALPGYRARHAVRPGIAGWAQVHYRYGDSLESSLEKLRYDLYYLKHRSIRLDLLILVKTIGVLLRGQGR